MNLSNFGKKLNFKKRIESNEVFTEVDIFIDTISRLEKCWDKSNGIYDIFKINLLEYEGDYFQIIENVLFMKYGSVKTEIILHYVYGRKDIKGNVNPLIVQIDDEKPVEINTPVELWEFLKNYKEDKK